MAEQTDVLLRLIAATLAGAVLGVDREIHRKPAGLRTLMLVGLGAALLTATALTELSATVDPLRVVQGIVSGIGFLGAGVILQRQETASVEGLTTAASIWLVAGLGIGFGLGRWLLAGSALLLAVIVLVGARELENLVRRLSR